MAAAAETQRPQKTAAKKSTGPKKKSPRTKKSVGTTNSAGPMESAAAKKAASADAAPEQKAERWMHAQDETQESAALSASAALATPLDLLLAHASTGPIRRFIPGMSGVKFTAGLVRHPQVIAKRTAGLAYELTRVGLGRSRMAPHEKDRRFSEEAWDKNPVFKRTLQSYLAVGEAVRGLVDVADLDWGDDQRMRFIVDNLVEAAAPSNNPFLNPNISTKRRRSGGSGGSIITKVR